MRRGGTLEANDRLDRRALEPREVVKRQEELSGIHEEPEAVLRDVCYLSFRSGWPRHLGSPIRVPRWPASLGAGPDRSARDFEQARSLARARTSPRRRLTGHGCA